MKVKLASWWLGFMLVCTVGVCIASAIYCLLTDPVRFAVIVGIVAVITITILAIKTWSEAE
jgi:hypothetical protein